MISLKSSAPLLHSSPPTLSSAGSGVTLRKLREIRSPEMTVHSINRHGKRKYVHVAPVQITPFTIGP